MIRVRINKAPTPSMKTGDQIGYGLHLPLHDHQSIQTATSTGLPSIPEVPALLANIEAEKGETVVGDFDGDGLPEHFKVPGKRHAEGGTPLHVPDGSFVYSDTRNLRLRGPILAEFGKNPGTKKKFTPAALSKQYDINGYKATLEDPTSDHLDRGTAELMIQNNSAKLGKLALVQEAIKGFPSGVPDIALPHLTGIPAMKYGGPVEPVDPHKGDRNDPRKSQRERLHHRRGFNKFRADWLPEYGFPANLKGLDSALLSAGYQGNLNNAREVQQFLVAENLRRGNTGLFHNLLSDYGMTNQAITKGFEEEPANLEYNQANLENIFADNLFGVRSGLMLKELLERDLKPSPVTAKPIPLDPGKPNVAGLVPQIPIPPSGSTPPKRNPEKETMPWWSQDIINTGAALANRYNIQKYMPTYVSPGVALPDSTFFDPTRQLAATQEQAAQQNQVAAMFAGPQRLRSVGSDIQGRAAAQAADVLGQVQNQNVQVANQNDLVRSQLLTDKSRMEAVARKTYLDELATVNQQYDNSIREAGDVFRGNVIGGMTNAQKTHWLNQFTPQFKIDPISGRISFTKGKGIREGGGAASTPNQLDAYKSYYDQFFAKMPDAQKAHEFAQRMSFGNRSRFQVDSDGDAEMTSSGYGMNPMALQLLGMYAPQFLQR